MVIYVYIRINVENTTRKYKLSRLRSVFDEFYVGCAMRTERVNLAMDDGAHGAPYSAVSVGSTTLLYIS